MQEELPQLDLELCRQRQKRVCHILAERKLDRAAFAAPEHVQYLTGFRPHHLVSAVVCLESDGGCLLVAPNAEPERHAASRVVTFEAQWLCTLRQDQLSAIADVLSKELKPVGRLGIEGSRANALLISSAGAPDRVNATEIEPDLLELRRRKDADELAMIRHAIGGTEAMYARAREIIEPGINELTVFNELQSAAVRAIGEPLTGTGNDYQSNAPGGPPRSRKAQAGELYILDLGPAYRGYFADNCRTFAVNRQPMDEQLKARDVIMSVLAHVERNVRPGYSCKALFNEAKALLDEYAKDAFFHHLGHGIGLFPHEAPHLNSRWDDTFQEGEVFTAEPGLYTPTLRAGIRIEEDYLVTATGIEKLTTFPTSL